MKEQIIAKMTKIVDETMERFHSDFYQYDKQTVRNATPDYFPMIWIVAKSHTHLLLVGELASRFPTEESVRLCYVEEQGEMFSYHFVAFTPKYGDRMFLITEDGISEIGADQGRNVVKDVFTPVVVKWEAEHGKLPKRTKVKVRFNGITITQLKELFAEEAQHGMATLRNKLHDFQSYTQYATDDKVVLSYDPEARRFIFRFYVHGEERLYGKIVFHGWPETGYMQNGSVQIDPQYGWHSHT